MARNTLFLLIGTLILPAPALAQGRVAPYETGTGGGPGSTITAPYTNTLGVTKPPGTSLGPGEVAPPQERQKERAVTNRIEDSICDGCN
ncbi:hypothetical protein [Methylobacterium sp. J-076]|uniref:hypothetical protein n=1 Tax=Methylobacterium sp. J-076 TaxID=2836655 RepID=UPI001FBB677F|nr:hypothetical protein [Methylobacterium sp. J-076]MCJ2011318.1 hypothetical protein [Methylobacterium sp. J-076]